MDPQMCISFGAELQHMLEMLYYGPVDIKPIERRKNETIG